MKTRWLALTAALLLLALGTSLAEAPLPEAAAPEELHTQETAVLYFRHADEPFLASEERMITLSPSRPFERALIDALLSGPASPDLTGLFPAGTRLLATARQARTLFVTFSGEILSPYPDEPETWREDLAWQLEAPQRRRLCMQSLVATVTENCDVDQVQVLVKQNGADSLRLDNAYFLREDLTGLADPLTRDDSLILTPGNTLSRILTLWQQRDWQRLYRYVALQGEDGVRAAYDDFVSRMEALPALRECSWTGGSLRGGGRTATFTLDATLRSAGQTERRHGAILRLRMENGLWRVSERQLTAWMEASP